MQCKTTCPYCGVGCGVVAEVAETAAAPEYEQPIRVSGDLDHPANQGRLCVKGSALVDTLTTRGRLLTPQLHGQPVAWDDALEQVAQGFTRTIAEHGPDAVAFYLSGQLLTEDYYVANKLIKGFIGTANIDTNSRLCMASAVVAHKRAFGSDTVPLCYDDIDQARLLVLVGSNAAWNHPILFQRMQAAKQRTPALKVVVIDPRHTATCELADLHLAIKPATDTLLFNGLLHYLAAAGRLNQPFIDQHTEGLAQALAEAERSAAEPDRVADRCDIARADLQQFYRWFTETERTVTFYSQGVNQSSSGVDNGNAIINCHLATGRIGKPGMGPLSITGQPNAMGGREVGGLANQLAAHMDFEHPASIDRVQRFWNAPNMAQRNGLKAVELFQAMERGEIKAVWIMATNPVVSLPDGDQVRRALQACPLVVVSDCVAQTDTSELAHIRLPATGWSEKDGTVTNSERCISRQRALLPARGEARHDWRIISDVARRMGFAAAFSYQSPWQIFREHAALSAFENNEQGARRDFDIGVLADISEAAYQQLQPIQWPVTVDAPQGTARMFSDGCFFTANGRARFIPIIPRPPQQQPDQQRPLVMNTGRIRDQWHTMTRTGLAHSLFQHRAEPFIELHPQDARDYGIEQNQLVQLSSPALTATVYIGRARITDSQRPGELFVPMHWNRQFASHGNMGSLIESVTDPLSGQPESKQAAVQLEPLPVQWQALLLSRGEQANLPALPINYHCRIPLQHSQSWRLASVRPVTDWRAWCAQHLSRPVLEFADPSAGHYRAAAIANGQLEWVLLVLPFAQLPDTRWLDSLFADSTIPAEQLNRLLAGCGSNQADTGPIVCSCFQIGQRAIEAEITAGACSVEQLGGTLACGTNCGSCVPELQALLRSCL
ncbi:MAG: molybdopterin-dependent oxidoreductase [Marinobacterium sp.]|nr:molybdopterin-dependent oxidoreductase [Marinobacterium sp.]